MKKNLFILLLVILATLAYTQPSRIQKIQLNPWLVYENWCTQQSKGAGQYYLGLHLTSNGKDYTIIYGVGNLSFQKNANFTGFTGIATQYFSNRLWAYPVSGNVLYIPQYPFDPAKTEKVNIKINSRNGEITLGNITFSVQSQNGVFYGFTTERMYSITLSKEFIPVIK